MEESIHAKPTIDRNEGQEILSETECSSTLSVTSSFGGSEDTPAKLSVSFGDVEIREYNVILGDNPAVSAGPPVTIDWIPISSHMLTVDEHQEFAVKGKDHPRDGGRMSAPERISYLIHSYSSLEIQAAQSRARKIQQSRKLNRRDKMESLRLLVEKVGKKCRTTNKRGDSVNTDAAQAWLEQYKLASKSTELHRPRVANSLAA